MRVAADVYSRRVGLHGRAEPPLMTALYLETPNHPHCALALDHQWLQDYRGPARMLHSGPDPMLLEPGFPAELAAVHAAYPFLLITTCSLQRRLSIYFAF
jgi:hypothetical protein